MRQTEAVVQMKWGVALGGMHHQGDWRHLVRWDVDLATGHDILAGPVEWVRQKHVLGRS